MELFAYWLLILCGGQLRRFVVWARLPSGNPDQTLAGPKGNETPHSPKEKGSQKEGDRQ